MRTEEEKKRAHYCVDHGHSKVRTADWGRVCCARCGDILGDGMTQLLDNSSWVFCEPDFLCFGCDTCRANYARLDEHDLALLPEEHRESLIKVFGERLPAS